MVNTQPQYMSDTFKHSDLVLTMFDILYSWQQFHIEDRPKFNSLGIKIPTESHRNYIRSSPTI